MIFIGKTILLILVSALAIGGGGWLGFRHGVHSGSDSLLDRPGLLAQLEMAGILGHPIEPGIETSQLVQQAVLFARYLNPPKPVDIGAEKEQVKPTVVNPEPKIVRSRFTLLATSVHPDDAKQSMALIEEPGAGHRWVREGMPVGHQVVAAIKKGRIVLKHRGSEKCDELLISRESNSDRQIPRKGTPRRFGGQDGVARLRIDD